MSAIDIRIADLGGGGTLDLAWGNTIWLDDNAAGWGWFVDPTPWDDSEFTTPGNQGEQGRMDLLSVLSHELGHALGFEHGEADDVMGETLAAGVRRTPAPRDRVTALIGRESLLDDPLTTFAQDPFGVVQALIDLEASRSARKRGR